MSTVSADQTPAPAYCGLSTREECTALAQAISIRARVKLAQAYAGLYESWIAEDQVRRDAAKASAAASPPARPDTPGQSATNSHTGQSATRPRRKPWSRLLRRAV